MLIEYRFKRKVFSFSQGEIENNGNIYTAIVGKNGTGKSRLMKAIIEEFIGKTSRRDEFRREKMVSPGLLDGKLSDKIVVNTLPSQIIAVSTSPFDKFPLDLRDNLHEKYSYLGLRNLRSTDLGMAYMSNIYMSLLKSAYGDESRISKIFEVLGFLGYNPIIKASYHLELPRNRINDVINSSNPVDSFIEFLTSNNTRPVMRSRYRGFLNEDRSVNYGIVERFVDIYSRMGNVHLKPRIDIVFEENGIHFELDKIGNIDDLFFLSDLGMASLREINLEKNSGSNFRIGDASSGEQSVVMSVLGIASQIEDNSLICIDEPEVCLHPEWQERYIDVLINTFKNFRGCQFLIATHSPLLVSKLRDENCYLVKMDDGSIVSASEVNRKSVDFQLANTFLTPGYKNEYLTRELISILTSFGETGRLDEYEKNKLSTLLSLKDKIEHSDPVFKLMEMAQEAFMEVENV
ncbi:AAA family ATPase [Vibrio diabolicus]